MPSPFPGMDPYLEGPLWTSVHFEIALEIARQLTPKLAPRYAAMPGRRLVMTTPDVEDGVAISTTDIRPDAAVVKQAPGHTSSGGAAVLEAPVELETIVPQPVPQLSIEIRDAQNRQLVTAIEVLSPWNKTGAGYEEYVAKRNKLLLSSAHLIEIDLLRSGQRVPMRQQLPGADYFVFLSRAGRRPHTVVWPIRLEQPLGEVPVPLLAGDADVVLDLQAVVNSVYDGFGYRYLIDYSVPPPIPLSESQWEWARKRISESR